MNMKRFGHIFLIALTVIGISLSAAPVANAGGPYRYASGQDAADQVRLTVCATDLGVRHTRGGTPFNYLHHPQTFTVKGVDAEFGSEWVYGFAWGNVNAHGYVQNGWFC
jgi:hypothetical protein